MAPHAVSGLEPTVAPRAVSGLEATVAPSSRATRPGDHETLVTIDPRHYAVGDEIARGGMGRILAARDRRLGRPVAIKELLIESPDLRARFEREARITAKLQHPNIVNILEAGEWPSGEPFYVMKLVTGVSLDKVIAERTTLADRLALIPNVIAVVDALAYAHDHRVIHRDLKPANVLLGEFGETVVIDWGLAKDLSDQTPEVAAPASAPERPDATVAGSIMGTPAYMPPEQATGSTVDERADVYALGAMLHHVLSGAPPFTGRTTDAILADVIQGRRAPLGAGVPTDLITIVDKAMAHAAADRYRTAKGLADDLKRFQTGQLVGAHRYTRRQLLRRWLRRHRGPVAIAAAAATLLAIGATISVMRIVRERDDKEEARRDAIAQGQQAERRLGELLTEQGRTELLAGKTVSAAALLAQAYELETKEGEPSASLRFLVRSAVQAVEGEQIGITTTYPRVESVAFSPDGARLLVIAGDNNREDGEVQVWDSHAGTLLRSYGVANTATWNADGTTLHLRQGDSLRILDAGSGAVRAESKLPSRPSAAAWHANILAASNLHGSAIYVADPTDGQLVRWLVPPPTRLLLEDENPIVRGLAISDDGAVLAVPMSSGVIQLWDPVAGQRREPRDGHYGPAAVCFVPKTRQLVSAGYDRTLRVWKSELDVTEVFRSRNELQSIACSPDGKVVATGGATGHVALWSANNGGLLFEREIHRRSVRTLAFDPKGERLASGGDDGVVRIVGVSSHRRVATIPNKTCLTASAVSMLVCRGDDKLVLRDASTGDVRGELPVSLDRLQVGGRRLANRNASGNVEIWDVVTRSRLAEIRSGFYFFLSPDGTQIVTTPLEAEPAALLRWDTGTGRSLGSVPSDASINLDHLLFADGDRLLRPHTDPVTRKSQVEIIDATTLRRVAAVPGYIDNRLALRGQRIATFDDKTRVWDLPSGSLRGTLIGKQPQFDPSGTRILTKDGRTVRVWDADTSHPKSILEHSDDLTSVAFVADGRWIVTGAHDGAVRVWDADTGKLLSVFGVSTRNVDVIAPAGTDRLLTRDTFGAVQLWDLSLESRRAAEITTLVRNHGSR